MRTLTFELKNKPNSAVLAGKLNEFAHSCSRDTEVLLKVTSENGVHCSIDMKSFLGTVAASSLIVDKFELEVRGETEDYEATNLSRKIKKFLDIE